MRTKRKVSLTLDVEVYEAMEKASEVQNMAKSQIAEEALKLWLRRETEALMARGYEEMAEEDEKMSTITFEAQREVLK